MDDIKGNDDYANWTNDQIAYFLEKSGDAAIYHEAAKRLRSMSEPERVAETDEGST